MTGHKPTATSTSARAEHLSALVLFSAHPADSMKHDFWEGSTPLTSSPLARPFSFPLHRALLFPLSCCLPVMRSFQMKGDGRRNDWISRCNSVLHHVSPRHNVFIVTFTVRSVSTKTLFCASLEVDLHFYKCLMIILRFYLAKQSSQMRTTFFEAWVESVKYKAQ